MQKRRYQRGGFDRRGILDSAIPHIEDARVDVVVQRVEEDIGDELDLIPTHIRRYGVNNIFQRVFSYLLGWKADGKPVKLAATAAGSLKVAATGAGLEASERNPTSDTDGWIALSGSTAKTELFTAEVSVVDIMSKDYDLYVQLSGDNVTFQPKKLMRGSINHMKSVDFVTLSAKFLNADTDGAHNASFEIVGYR